MDMLISINLRHPQADSLDLFQAKRLPELKILSKSRLKLYIYIYRYSTCYDKYILYIYICYIIDLKLGRNLSIFSVDCEFRQDLLPAEPAVCVPVQSTITA